MHKATAASKRYIFQLSLIDTEEEEVSLKAAIEKLLGGEVDDSPVKFLIFITVFKTDTLD